jgi:hypothetical protein
VEGRRSRGVISLSDRTSEQATVPQLEFGFFNFLERGMMERRTSRLSKLVTNIAQRLWRRA